MVYIPFTAAMINKLVLLMCSITYRQNNHLHFNILIDIVIVITYWLQIVVDVNAIWFLGGN